MDMSERHAVMMCLCDYCLDDPDDDGYLCPVCGGCL